MDKKNVTAAWDNKGDSLIGNEETIWELLRLRWRDWDAERIKRNIAAIQRGSIDTLCKLKS